MAEILITVGVGEIRIARVTDGRLEEFSCHSLLGQDAHSSLGDIILGRVQRVMPGMQAAFVEIGGPRSGFLALREAQILAKRANADISACVQEGQAILVQVIKDPIGEKGARLSAAITIPGRFLVMTPGQPGLVVSRRIETAAERGRLMQLGEALLAVATPGTGFIFRTAAEGASLDDLRQDALALDAAWRGVEEKRRTARPPAILHRDLGPVERRLRDMLGSDAMLIDNQAAAQAARLYCRQNLPGMEEKITYDAGPLFDRHNLEEEIARLYQPRLPLASGGWITIEATEALTAIDVNSGSQTGALEETGFAVNLEAAREIGRQIRLRGTGGLIVVDFIQMTEAKHRAAVVAALSEGLASDRVPVQISPMAEFGIVVITRKKLREPLNQRGSETCAVCHGTGHRPTAQRMAQQLLRRIEAEARAWPGRELLVTAAPMVTEWLEQNGAREALAARGIARVQFERRDGPREAFDVAPG